MRGAALAFILGVAGCAGALPTARDANALSDAAARIEDGIAVACTTAAVAAPDDATKNRIEGRCHEVWRLYDRFRADWDLLAAALEAAERAHDDPNIVNVVELYARVEASYRAFMTAAADLVEELKS